MPVLRECYELYRRLGVIQLPEVIVVEEIPEGDKRRKKGKRYHKDFVFGMKNPEKQLMVDTLLRVFEVMSRGGAMEEIDACFTAKARCVLLHRVTSDRRGYFRLFDSTKGLQFDCDLTCLDFDVYPCERPESHEDFFYYVLPDGRRATYEEACAWIVAQTEGEVMRTPNGGLHCYVRYEPALDEVIPPIVQNRFVTRVYPNRTKGNVEGVVDIPPMAIHRNDVYTVVQTARNSDNDILANFAVKKWIL